MVTPLDQETAAKDDLLAWDDGGEYARAAEAAGVDVGGMLEAGVDAKRLLDFVSNFRRREGKVPLNAYTIRCASFRNTVCERTNSVNNLFRRVRRALADTGAH